MANAVKDKTSTSKGKEVKMNIYQKLIEARKRILEKGIVKGGNNQYIGYKYFELEDIVPAATDIFEKLGLIALVTFSEEEADMVLVDTDDPNENIVFTSPMRYPKTNNGTNEVQALGAAQTYLRRYLYLMALDIVEPDEIEPKTKVNVGSESPTVLKPKAPKTPQERKETVKKLTATDEMADPLQVEQLKKVLTRYKEEDPEEAEKLANYIGVKTKGFTEITRSQCEELIKRITMATLNKHQGEKND